MRLNISALLSFLSFMFIILFLLITLRVPSSNGYEFSIYDRYPWYFWVLIFLSYVTGYMAIIKESIHINHNTNKYWIFGFIAILLVDLYLLFLPTLVRGYVVYGRGDVLSHIGYVKDILSYNFLMTYNIYPIEHVSVAILCLISNLRVESIVRIYPQILSFLNILFLIALIKLIFGNKREFLLAFVCASILFYGNSYFFFAPTWQAFYILPLIIFIFYKLITSKKLILEFIIISLLVSFIYDLYHPINTIFLIIIICSLICIYCWLHLANLRFSTDILKHFILINSITIWTWYISFPRIDQSLKEMFFGIRTSTFQQYATLISYSNPRIQDLITVIIYRYGCYISVSLLTSILLVYMYTKNKKLNLKFYEIYFLLNYILFIFISFVALFKDVFFDYFRPLYHSLFFSAILLGSLFGSTINSRNKDSIRLNDNSVFIVSFFAISIIIYLSIFSLYPTPLTKDPNPQVTNNELSGMTWLFDNRNQESMIHELGIFTFRFYHAAFGILDTPPLLSGESATIIDHFNYPKNKSLYDYYKGNRYFVITSLGRKINTELYPAYENYWRFTSKDFGSLEGDTKVLKVLKDNDITIYYIEKLVRV